MLVTLLAAAVVTVSPSIRPDDANRLNPGLTLSVVPTPNSRFTFGIRGEHVSAETTVFGENAYSLIPRVQTLGGVVGFALDSRPYHKASVFGGETYWYRRGRDRFSMDLTLHSGIRRFRYDIPSALPAEHQGFLRSWEGTDFYITPGYTVRFHFSRLFALEANLGWEFGSSPREFRRLQSSVGFSSQF